MCFFFKFYEKSYGSWYLAIVASVSVAESSSESVISIENGMSCSFSENDNKRCYMVERIMNTFIYIENETTVRLKCNQQNERRWNRLHCIRLEKFNLIKPFTRRVVKSTVCTYRQITRSLFCLIFSEFVCVWKVLHLGVRIRWLCANDVTCEQMIFMTTTLSTSTLTLTSIRQHTTAADTHRNQRASGNRAHITTMKHAKY